MSLILILYLAGCRGLVVTALSSGDRVCESKSWPWQSDFFCLLFLLLLLLPLSFFLFPLCALSLMMPVVTCSSVNTCLGGGKKRGITENPCSAISEANIDLRAMSGNWWGGGKSPRPSFILSLWWVPLFHLLRWRWFAKTMMAKLWR